MKKDFRVHTMAAAKTPRKTVVKAAPVTVVKAHPAVMRAATALARGRDVRLEVQRDGSVIIRNGAR